MPANFSIIIIIIIELVTNVHNDTKIHAQQVHSQKRHRLVASC